MRHAVIMAGGAGTRLWPLSLRNRPKQFLRIVEGKSLLRLSFERLAGWLPADCIHVITGETHLPLVRQELPELPDANLVGEPCGRDTLNAIGMMAHSLHRTDPDGVMGVFTADHVIRPAERFREAVARAYDLATRSPDALITLGVKPTSPHTGFGYIHRGAAIEPGVYAVRGFKEKPSPEVAQQYVAGGEHLWNSGMFVWRASAFLAELARHAPDAHAKLGTIAAADGGERLRLLRALYPTLARISVDFAVMEKAERVLVVELPCDWLDVGSWTALDQVLRPDAAGNVRSGAAHRVIDASGNILVADGDHLLAAVGVEDLVIVHGPRATLVCHKSAAQRIRDLVAELEREGGVAYL